MLIQSTQKEYTPMDAMVETQMSILCCYHWDYDLKLIKIWRLSPTDIIPGRKVGEKK